MINFYMKELMKTIDIEKVNCKKIKKGKYYYINGEQFEGEFENDKCLKGKYTYKDGTSVEGQWKDEKLTGLCKFTLNY